MVHRQAAVDILEDGAVARGVGDGQVQARLDTVREVGGVDAKLLLRKLRNGFVDRGISGQTTAEMLARFRRDVIDLNPKAVVILAGINDIAQNNGAIKLENVFGNIVSMCELAKFNGIRVVLCSVLPCDRFSWRPEIKPAAAVAELNTMLRQYAAEHKIPYVDYHAALDNGSGGLDARISRDGCHPTLYGYTLMEPMVVEGINKALRTKQARYTTPIPNE